MANTITGSVAAGTWVALPDVSAFTVQSLDTSDPLIMRASATVPTGAMGGHAIAPNRTGGRLTTGIHYIYSRYGCNYAFTEDDR